MVMILLGLLPVAAAQADRDTGQPPSGSSVEDQALDAELARLLAEYQRLSETILTDVPGEGERMLDMAGVPGPLQVCTMPAPLVDSRGQEQSYCWLNRPDQPIWGRVSGGTAPYGWCWDFGDGSAQDCGVATTPAQANLIFTTHQYATLGQKCATLTITDATGARASASVCFDVVNCDLDVRTNAAIEDGLRYLYQTQFADGRWTLGGGVVDIATSGVALLNFQLRQHFQRNDPCVDIYQGTVSRAIDFLLSQTSLTGVAQGLYPDVNGDGLTVRFGSGHHSGYSHGLAMMGLSSSQALDYVAPVGPVTGWTLRTVLENAAEQCYRAQAKSGFYRGGWRYDIHRSDGDADNSVSQWPILGLHAAQEAGIPIAQQCLDELRLWTTTSQGGDGGFGYTNPGEWRNIAKTGAGLLALALLGDDTSQPAVQSALDFIDVHWGNGSDGVGVREHMNGNIYATYAVAKACRTVTDAVGAPVTQIGTHLWYDEYRNLLLQREPECGVLTETSWRQNQDGSWPDGYWMGSANPATTSFALLVLIPAVVECVPVADGIATPNPISCPNVPVHFDGTASYHQCDAGGAGGDRIVEWCWDFDESDGVDWNNPDACGAVVDFAAGYPLPSGQTVKYANLRVKDDTPAADGGPKYGYKRLPITLNNENNPPVACLRPGCANFPPYSGRVGEAICFDGSPSFDPDVCRGDEVVCYRWDLDGDGQYDDGEGATICFTWNEEYTGQVGLQVCDTQGLVSTNAIYVNVYASRRNLSISDPQISMQPLCTVPCGLPSVTIRAEVYVQTEGGAQTVLPPTSVEFYDGDPLAGGQFIGAQPIPGGAYGPQTLTFDQVWNVVNPLAQHRFFVVVDPQDAVAEWNEATDNIASLLQPDNEPPDCSAAVVEEVTLWPPNHRMVPVHIVGVTDPDGDPITVRVTGITQDEPLNEEGDGNTCPDGAIHDGVGFVRAERSGRGDGRIYTIEFEASDDRGGNCQGTVKVCVPRDMGQASVCLPSPTVFRSTGECDLLTDEGAETPVAELAIGRIEVAGRVASIEYALPGDTNVSLGLFDVSGRMVVQLENSFRAAGRYQASFNTTGLGGGVYFCRLNTRLGAITKSLLILK
jgi:hypothetical protein